jgi:putative oxidoreductase
MDGGLLLIRVVLGAIVAAHGAQKLFGWFGGHGIRGTAGWLESMQLRPGRVFATVNGLAEFGGGALIALGFLTPLGAAAVAGVMFVAVALVHLRNGFFNSAGGYEFNLLIAATAIALAVTGPGRFSLDNIVGWDLAGPEWGIAAFGVAAAAAGTVLVVRALAPAAAQEDEDRGGLDAA